MPSSLPYPANTLHPPLNSAQRQRIISYLKGNGYSETDIAKYLGWPPNVPLKNYTTAGGGSPGTLAEFDRLLIEIYNATASGGGFQSSPKVKTVGPNIPGVSSVVDFLKLLANPNTWLRVAEVLLGMLLVGAGLAKMSQRAAVVIRQVPIAGKAIA